MKAKYKKKIIAIATTAVITVVAIGLDKFGILEFEQALNIISNGEHASEKVNSNNSDNIVKSEEENNNFSTQTLYEVVRVVDGDTIIVKYNGEDVRVRMIGIDTAESVHPDESKNTQEGKNASDYTKQMLTDKKVALEFDVQQKDKYGRFLAYVYLDGKMYNKTLLENGYAKIATYPPNVKYVDDFVQLQKEARENQIGIWRSESE